MSKDKIGKRVVIYVNDFQLVDTVATIVMVDIVKKKFLLQLDQPVLNSNRIYKYVSAAVRWPLDNIDTLFISGEVGCLILH
jgi:hypothetical protein